MIDADKLYYYSRARYISDRSFVVLTDIAPGELVVLDNDHYEITLHADGMLCVSSGYWWDGSSGPAIDTEACKRASLVHDALYELMGRGVLDRKWQKAADRLYRDLCIQDGMWKLRAKWRYAALRLAGKRAIDKYTPLVDQLQVAPP